MAGALAGRHGVAFGRLDRRVLMFSEARQAIYEVADPALENGAAHLSPCAAPTPLGPAPVVPARAATAPRHAARAEAALSCPPLWLSLAGRAVALSWPRARAELGALAGQVFGHLRCAPAPSALPVRLVAVGGASRDTLAIEAPGRARMVVAGDEWLVRLKGLLLDHVLETGDHEVALHAAAVRIGRSVTLLLGPPGAGKTVLALALEALGATVEADDVALVRGDGRIVGVALALAVKQGGWPLVERFRALGPAPVQRRPDGQRVRFVAPRLAAGGQAPGRSWPVARVVLLARAAGARPRLVPVERLAALAALLGEASRPDERLGVAGFEALLALLARAETARLDYDDPLDAAALLGAGGER